MNLWNTCASARPSYGSGFSGFILSFLTRRDFPRGLSFSVEAESSLDESGDPLLGSLGSEWELDELDDELGEPDAAPPARSLNARAR